MLNRILQHQFYDAPDDNNGGQHDDHQPDDGKKPVDPDPDDKPGDDNDHKVPAKDQRKIRQDAVNQFKNSDEFKQMIAETMADGEKRAKMSADEKAEADRKAQEERDQQEREKFHREQAHFYAQQELASRHLPDTFADYIADQDHDTMVANADSFERAFTDAVHEETLKRMQGDQTPASGTHTPNTSVTKKDWDAMSYSEQLAIYQKNPQLAKQFMS